MGILTATRHKRRIYSVLITIVKCVPCGGDALHAVSSFEEFIFAFSVGSTAYVAFDGAFEDAHVNQGRLAATPYGNGEHE